MIRSILACICLAAFFVNVNAQKPDPVHWQYSTKKIDDKTFELHITARMDDPWHIYAQAQPKEAIAVPTKISFSKNPLIFMASIPKEMGKKETYRDDNAGIVQYQYGGTLDFVQTINLRAAVKTSISGAITYQACNNEMCLPPKTVSFNISIE